MLSPNYSWNSAENDEYRLLNEKLRTNEAELRQFLAAMPNLVLVLDAEAKSINVIPTQAVLDPEANIELIDLTIEQFYQPERSPTFLQQIREALTTQETIQFEYSLRKNQRELWFVANISPLAAESVVWVVTEITDSHQAKIALQQAHRDLEKRVSERTAALEASESRFRRLAENAKDVIYRYRLFPNREVEYINPAIATVTGYTAAEFYANPDLLWQIIHREDRQIWQKELERCGNWYGSNNTRNDDPRFSLLILRWLHRDGKIIWIEQHNTFIEGDRGQIIAIEGIARNISRQIVSRQQTKLLQKNFKLPYQQLGVHLTFPNSLPTWVAGIVTTGVTLTIELLRQSGIRVPVPYLLIIVTVVLSGSLGGLKPGLVSSIVWILYLIWAASVPFGPPTLTGGVLPVSLGGIAVLLVAVVQGHKKDQNDRLNQALRFAHDTLDKRVEERTAALAKSNEILREQIVQRQVAEAELQAIADNATDFIVRFDRQFRHLFVNKALTNFVGISFADYLGKTNEELGMSSELCQLWNQSLQTTFLIGKLQQIEFDFATDDGIRTFQSTIIPEKKANCRIETLLVITRDITAQKRIKEELEKRVEKRTLELIQANGQLQKELQHRRQIETALRDSQQQLQAILYNAPAVIYVTDLEHKYLLINREYEKLFNVEQEKIKGQSIYQVWERKFAELFEANNQQVIQTKVPITSEEIAPHPDGIHTYVTIKFPLFDENDLVYAVGGISTDITPLKQTEASLKEAERRWRSLLENVRLIVVGLDKAGNVDYVNPFFLELTKYTKAEVLAKNWFKNFLPHHHQTRTFQGFSELIENNFHLYYQNSILTKSGEERLIAWNNTLLRNAEGEIIGTLSIGQDITERFAIERMKDEFISVVSHELRTPLTSIHGALNLLSSGLLELSSDRATRAIKIAAEAAERLVRLVNDILELERLESGKISLRKQQVNVENLFLQVSEQMQVMADRAGIELEVLPADINLNADPDRVLQVLTNLISNALKFSDPGKTVWLSVDLGENETGSLVRFQVRDRGRGIPADKIETIFERFHQVDASDSRQKGGTGLGLAICRSIVEQHGGKIWVESVLNQGSSFYFTLPRAKKS
ncbi:MAG: PAS domain S-box protein [Oscillatoria sp. PMC 1068.18]|nr:PAS domain S-box protein [Oscillatoria sp. PMC 1076.18]MEC4991202.1 PAS domain S-box protein [Oscillatoria sp. PMC 1068.18]